MKKTLIIIFAVVFYSILAYNLDKIYKENIRKDTEINKLKEQHFMDSLMITNHE